MAYLEVDRTTLEESKVVMKVVKKVTLPYIDAIKNNFNDFISPPSLRDLP